MSKQTFIRLRSKATGEWFVHPDLRTRLVEDAERLDTSLTDVVNRILAARFQVTYEPQTRPSKRTEGVEDQLTLRLTPQIETAAKVLAATSGAPWQDVLRRTLSDHYGLPTDGSPVAA